MGTGTEMLHEGAEDELEAVGRLLGAMDVPLDVRGFVLASVRRGFVRGYVYGRIEGGVSGDGISDAFWEARHAVGVEDLVADIRARAEAVDRYLEDAPTADEESEAKRQAGLTALADDLSALGVDL